MGGIMGGGGQSGGAVVGGPSPSAAYQAGGILSQAASAAASAAKEQTNMAINAIREQYNNAFMNLKPYTTTGIQALDELNSYLGLNAYNPGTAPSSPDPINDPNYWVDRIAKGDIRNYINENLEPVSNTLGQYFGNSRYVGAGSEPGIAGATVPNNEGTNSGWMGTPYADVVLGNNIRGIINNPDMNRAIRMELAQDKALENQDLYKTNLDSYNQQMDVYNYAKDLYGKYTAAGPLTPDQVSAKLSQTPGYQFQLGQGMDAIQRAASAKGVLGSGRLLQSLVDYSQGLASQTYGEHLSRLASLAGAGQNAATSLSGYNQNVGNGIASLRSNLGDTIANSYLSAANARSQALLAANQQYQVIGGNSGSGMGGIGSLLGGVGSLLGASAGGGSGLLGLFG